MDCFVYMFCCFGVDVGFRSLLRVDCWVYCVWLLWCMVIAVCLLFWITSWLLLLWFDGCDSVLRVFLCD